MPRRIQKSITLDVKKLETFERNFPHLNFSQWVEDQMSKFTRAEASPKAVQTQKQREVTASDSKVLSRAKGSDPLKITDRAQAEARAREILESLGQTGQKVNENLARIMQRWDDLHVSND
jgi:phosphopantetheinyl transferase (holo-ACP synthase)